MCDTNNFWKFFLSHIVVHNTSFYLSYCTYNNSQYWSHRTPVKWSPNLVLWYSFVNHDLACICVYELWPAWKKGKRRFILVLTRYFENIDQTSQSKQKSTCFKYIWCLGGQNGSDTWPYFLCILSSYPNHYGFGLFWFSGGNKIMGPTAASKKKVWGPQNRPQKGFKM